MICDLQPDPRLGVFICSYCGKQSKTNTSRECTVSEVQRMALKAAGRKRKGCGCKGKKKQA